MPQPTPGTVRETVKPKPTRTAKPVRLSGTAEPEKGLVVKLAGLRPVTTEAKLPGEVSGPGLQFRLVVQNRTGSAVDLSGTVVGLSDSDGNPAVAITTEPAKPIAERVRGRSEVTGVYLFTVAEQKRDDVTITVSLAADQPVLTFRGKP